MSANEQPQPNQRIEPGTLCLILNAPLHPEHVGKQCIAIELLQPGQYIRVEKIGTMRVTEPLWAIEIQGQLGKAIARPGQLLPISGHRPQADELLDTIPALQRRNSRQARATPKGASNA